MTVENSNQFFNVDEVYKGLELKKEYENDVEFVNSLLKNAWGKLHDQLDVLDKIDDINKENNKDKAQNALDEIKEISECIFVKRIVNKADELKKSITEGNYNDDKYREFVEILHKCYDEYQKTCCEKEDLVFYDLTKSLNMCNKIKEEEDRKKEEKARKVEERKKEEEEKARKVEEEKKRKEEEERKQKEEEERKQKEEQTKKAEEAKQAEEISQQQQQQSQQQHNLNGNDKPKPAKSRGCCMIM